MEGPCGPEVMGACRTLTPPEHIFRQGGSFQPYVRKATRYKVQNMGKRSVGTRLPLSPLSPLSSYSEAATARLRVGV